MENLAPASPGLICPRCRDRTAVVRTVRLPGVVARSRRCRNCGHAMKTEERPLPNAPATPPASVVAVA